VAGVPHFVSGPDVFPGERKLSPVPEKSSAVFAARSAARIASAYTAWAIFWIVMSDTLVQFFFGEQQLTATFQTVKGLIFIGVTAALLFWLIVRQTHQLMRVNSLVAQHVEQLKQDIVERTRAERALLESEREFRTLVVASAQIVWSADEQGATTEISSAFAELTGFAAMDAYGLGWLEAVHPEDRARARSRWAAALEIGSIYNTEYRLRTIGGAWRLFEVRGVPVRGDDGRIRKWLGTCTDIEDRRVAEEEATAGALKQAVVSELGIHALSGAQLGNLFERAVRKTSETLGVEYAVIAQPMDEGKRLMVRADWGWNHGALDQVYLDSGRGSHAGYALSSDQPVIATDYASETRFTLEPMLRERDVVSGISTTVRGRTGQYGVISAHSVKARTFGPGDVHFLQGVANVLATAIERVQADEKLAYIAQHDTLTGLPNRALLEDRLAVSLAQAHRAGNRVALMYVDLDQFKLINDSIGHQAGDALLKLAAQRFTSNLREGDTVSRQGGDEFTMIFPNLESIEAAALVAQKLLDAMALPFKIGEEEAFLTASIGIAIYPDDALQSGELIRRADAAMYRAKEKGRNAFHFFTPDINAGIEDRLRIETGLRNAVARNEFRVVYQPQIDLQTGKVAAVEALLRWTSGTMGVVPPDRFISIAEATGAIIAIGEWVLRSVCEQARAWHQAGFDGLNVVVNLSARQFSSPTLVQTVTSIVHESGYSLDFLEVEITESDAMRDAEAAVDMISELKALGVSISIDDFGTGYSSLSYLKRFDADVLKIDQSFVRDIATDHDDATIAASIITLAHSLGMRVVAEGIETEGQLRFLVGAGCDVGQGFLLSRPLEADQVAPFIQRFLSQDYRAFLSAA